MATIDSIYSTCCEDRFPLPTDDEVAALEKRLKLRFPKEYRAFLLKYNGGRFSYSLASIVFPEPLTVVWRDGKVTHDSDGLESMCGFHPTHPTDELGRAFDINLFDGNDPIQLLVIGRTVTGSLLLMDMLPGAEGEILIKFPNEYAYTIADNINEFFRLIDPTFKPIDDE